MDLKQLKGSKLTRAKKELLKLKCSPNELNQKIAICYEEYNHNKPIIDEKLKQAKALGHTKEYNRIKEFEKDTEELKGMLDNLAGDFQKYSKKGLMNKLKRLTMTVKVHKFTFIVKKVMQMENKYKNEDCDIENFKV